MCVVLMLKTACVSFLQLELMAIQLLKRGANLETKDDYGYTPFLKAVKNDAPGCIVDLLLERGADVHAVAEDRKTALHFAAQKSEEQIIRQMIKSGLSVEAEDKDGWTPLHEAARYGSKVATAKNGQSYTATAIYICFISISIYICFNVCLQYGDLH